LGWEWNADNSIRFDVDVQSFGGVGAARFGSAHSAYFLRLGKPFLHVFMEAQASSISQLTLEDDYTPALITGNNAYVDYRLYDLRTGAQIAILNNDLTVFWGLDAIHLQSHLSWPASMFYAEYQKVGFQVERHIYNLLTGISLSTHFFNRDYEDVYGIQIPSDYRFYNPYALSKRKSFFNIGASVKWSLK
jgi:hypothetical protein